MKRKIIRIVAIVAVLAMFASLVSACRDDSAEMMEIVLPEFVYVPEVIPFPSGIGDVYNQSVAISSDKVFFAATTYEFDEETYESTYYSRLYSMSIDDSEFTELPKYTPPGMDIPDDASGGFNVNSLSVDIDGNLWVNEAWNFYGYDLPDNFNPDTDQAWEYYIDLGSGSALRKLDPTGAEILTVDVSGISNQQQFYVNSFNTDGAGNIYIYASNWETGSQIIYVLDGEGNKQFELSATNWIDRLIRLPDGTIAFRDNAYTGGVYSPVLQTINFDARAFGETIDAPSIGWNTYSGNDEFDFFLSDEGSLYGYTIGADEPEKLLNWLDSDLMIDGLQNIEFLPDGRIICVNSTYNRVLGEQRYELIILTKTPYSQLPEKTVLSLATLSLWNIRAAVVHFNRTNPDYRIAVIDYSEFNSEDDWSAGLTRLTAEITAGKVPDILDISNLQSSQYISSGLLLDLYRLIDADPDINRSDLMEGAFKAAEVDGGLYSIFPSFTVSAIVGHPSIMGTGLSWTPDEFRAILDAHPDADMPLGQWLTKSSFLQSALSLDLENYIDWEKGTTSFDSESFIQLLESANMFHADYGTTGYDYIPDEELLAAGRQIMRQAWLSSIWDMRQYKAMHGGEIAIKGFPTEKGSGISLNANANLAICTASKNVEGAWAFVKTILDKDRQLEGNDYGFPTNKAAFDAKLDQEIEQSQGPGESTFSMGYGDGSVYTYTLKPITQEDVDLMLSAIESATGTSGWGIEQALWDIISEGASDYFNGVSSAQDAARVIQSRASILVSERS